MLFCGLRRGECLALTVADIDFEQKRININKSLSLRKNIGKLTGTKTQNMRKKKIKNDENIGKREIPLPDILMPFLISQCQNKKPTDIVFTKSDGKHATQQTCSWWWKSFLRQCHIISGAELYRNQIQIKTSPFSDDITPHYLRHTYATDIFAADVDEKTQKYFLGHTSNDVTDIYRKMNEAAFSRAAKKINKYYNSLDYNHENFLECAKYATNK
jgi:integrase